MAADEASRPNGTLGQVVLSPVEILKRIRDPFRIRSSDAIERLVCDFEPFASPDPALIAGEGHIGDFEVLVLAQQKPKGRAADELAAVNFGMMTALGYWFVVEQLNRAAATGKALLTLIDTPGADPSKHGAQHLLAWAISSSITRLCWYPGPSVSVILGEGGSGGALALQVTDRRLIASDAMFSVISPESCSAILYRDSAHIVEAMDLLRPTAHHMLGMGIVDTVVDWPGDMATTDYDEAAKRLGGCILDALEDASAWDSRARIQRRLDALWSCGGIRPDRHRSEETSRASSVSAGARPAAASLAPRKFHVIGSALDDHAFLERAYYLHRSNGRTSVELVCPRQSGGCGDAFSQQDYEAAGWACPTCGRGERLGAYQWIELLCDPGTFEESWRDLDLADLDDGGHDNERYRELRRRARRRYGVGEALVIGVGRINQRPCALAVSDFRFFAGTLGAVCGEKIRLICETAIGDSLPLVTVTCSGGVRMQDGTLGLAQMAKANAAVQLVMRAGQPYVSVLADPCTGGALGSYATQGTVVLSEPHALLAFAGPRVMKLAGFPVNEELLSSETLAHYGGVDVVVPRRHMKTRISRCLQLGQEPTESLACERYSTSGHDLGRWYAGFSSRMSALLDEAHEILAFESGSRMVETPVLTQLSHVALVSIPRLFRHIAARSPDARVRASAIEALGRFRGDDHTHLVEALRDPHRRVCTNAAVALLCDDPKNAEAMAVLQSLMASADPVDRRAGLYGLVRIPIDALRDDLRRLTNDPVVSVQLSAAVALIVSQDLPTGRDALRNVVSIMGRSALGQARRLARYAPPGTLETLEAVMAEFESELASARTPPAPA